MSVTELLFSLIFPISDICPVCLLKRMNKRTVLLWRMRSAVDSDEAAYTWHAPAKQITALIHALIISDTRPCNASC